MNVNAALGTEVEALLDVGGDADHLGHGMRAAALARAVAAEAGVGAARTRAG